MCSTPSFFSPPPPPPTSTLFPYTTLFRSLDSPTYSPARPAIGNVYTAAGDLSYELDLFGRVRNSVAGARADRKSTRLNSSHVSISYAVFCLKKKKPDILHSLL